jgi:outer membrane lipoprotein carrier protein
MKLLTAVALAGTLGGPVASPAASTPAEDLARRLEQHHRAVGDLTARFVQTYRSGLIGREIVERGVVSIKQPGRMRWEYRDPEKKTFVSDGKTFYFYVPADRQVIVRDQAGDRGVTALLLSGRGNLLEQFEVGTEPGPPGLARLRLVPRKPDPEVQKVFVDVDDTARIHAIHLYDAQGNLSRFDFTDIRENVGLNDRLFRFEIPRGVEVISG